MPKLRKLAKLAGIGLLGLLGLNYAGRHITRNVMSHCGYREESCDFVNPNTYITRGYYKGFVNLFVYPEVLTNYYSEDNPDPNNFKPDPYDKFNGPLHDLDLNSVYLGLKENPLPRSQYRPTSLRVPEDTVFYSLVDFIQKPEQLVSRYKLGLSDSELEKIMNLKPGEAITWREVNAERLSPEMENAGEWLPPPQAERWTNVDLHDYTLSFGKDERGIYTSIYDMWDYTPNSGFFRKQINNHSVRAQIAALVIPLVGTPIHFYDRLYWEEYQTDI